MGITKGRVSKISWNFDANSAKPMRYTRYFERSISSKCIGCSKVENFIPPCFKLSAHKTFWFILKMSAYIRPCLLCGLDVEGFLVCKIIQPKWSYLLTVGGRTTSRYILTVSGKIVLFEDRAYCLICWQVEYRPVDLMCLQFEAWIVGISNKRMRC